MPHPVYTISHVEINQILHILHLIILHAGQCFDMLDKALHHNVFIKLHKNCYWILHARKRHSIRNLYCDILEGPLRRLTAAECVDQRKHQLPEAPTFSRIDHVGGQGYRKCLFAVSDCCLGTYRCSHHTASGRGTRCICLLYTSPSPRD